jgi:mRNA degradation ribonuclease J1/J2
MINSMENGIAELGFGSHVNIPCVNVPDVNLPDLLLITHPHNDHIKELPLLLSKASDHKSIKLKIMCTQRCLDQITQIFPNISEANKALFDIVTPGENYSIGPFSITPVLTKYYNDNDNSSTSDSVIYILKITDKKIIMGWDFLSVDPSVDQNLFWNPDLLILGTETYNHHPETGMISVKRTTLLEDGMQRNVILFIIAALRILKKLGISGSEVQPKL